MRVLFVKQSQSFPRSSGHDVHGYFMMRALQDLGSRISLLTRRPVSPEAVEGLELEWCGDYAALPEPNHYPKVTGLREKFRTFWGVDEVSSAKVGAFVEQCGFDAVVVVAADGLPLMCHLHDTVRVWYAADDQLLHKWSLFKWNKPSTWRRFPEGLLMGLYERSFRNTVDRVWMVSEKDASFSRCVMGARNVDLVTNGVDFDYFAPMEVVKQPKSCVFWGRLDFAPNLDAIRWFGDHVWRVLHATHPDAVWTVYGFAAGESVHELQKRFGFHMVCDLPDLRAAVSGHEVVVLPFVSGAGIKNKLLEAAGLGMPIIASKMALNGLERSNQLPMLLAHKPSDWITNLETLWGDAEERMRVGAETRDWVVHHHSWMSSARIALEGMLRSQEQSRVAASKA